MSKKVTGIIPWDSVKISKDANVIFPPVHLFTYGGSMASPYPKEVNKQVLASSEADVEFVTDDQGHLLYLNLPNTPRNVKLLSSLFPPD